ncbi:MAG TPA: ribose-phosphate pyrophosphokinase [Armatimonadota bacterium]|nr:ribose-phosphate pyrophosphokinase [Armatimonadota bacterium]
MDAEKAGELRLLSGNANKPLSQAIADRVGLPLSSMEVTRFADGEIRVRIEESVRGADVFLIQPTSPPTSENIMELLVILDALKRASTRRTTAVIPYYAYARQEKKTKPREPISAKLIADLISVAGADRILTVDLHVQSIQGFFNIPVDHIPAGPILADDLVSRGLTGPDIVVVSPDVGGVSTAKALADRLSASLAIIAKRRPEPNLVEVVQVIGELAGKCAILADDMIDTAGSVVSAAEMVADKGASEIYAYATHALLSGDAVAALEAAPIKEVVLTDTIPIPPAKKSPKIRVLSVAPIVAEAIKRVHADSSVSTIFGRYWEDDKK